jgi:subtilase family serine protease
LRRLSIILSLAAVLSLSMFATSPHAFANAKTSRMNASSFSDMCGAVPKGKVRCMAIMKLVANAGPTSGFGPSDLQSAYNLPSATAGQGQTVAIVDAQDDPNAESDLAVYRSQFGLPPCTTANGCFRKLDENGGTNYPSPDSGWSGEISLDVDMVSAICPNCHIMLFEASSANFSDLATAVDTAAKMGANAISNSYGGSEDPSETSVAPDYSHPGVAITASTGDSGYGTAAPSVFSTVIAVGGTSLTQDSSTSRGWSETAWSEGGSGCSSYISKPAWQTDTDCTMRTVADVSAVADPNTGVAVYDTYQQNGWVVFGGTSVSSPIIASVYALAGNGASLKINDASYAYSHASDLNDVTTGSNGICFPLGSYLCNAGPGYDGPTGLGTPNGVGAF